MWNYQGRGKRYFLAEKFFVTCRAKSEKSGKFVSTHLIFSFRYAHDNAY
jgi:hypothetical protein